MTDDIGIARKDPDLIELSGMIERVIYYNEDTTYAVCELEYAEAEFLTIVGNMPYVAEGETITVLGKWEIHPSFGRQLKVQYYEKTLPTNTAAILKYLSSNTVKGIGPITAKRIVEHFGDDTFEVLENHPEWLADVPGISERKARDIGENFREQFGIRTVMMFCREYFGPALSVRIYNTWGVGAVDIIKNEPFRLCEEIYGVSFEKADSIASSFGFKKNSPERIKSGIKYVLSLNAIQNGHCYIPENKLIEGAAKMLGIEEEEAQAALDTLCDTVQTMRVQNKGVSRIYLYDYFEAERFTASKLLLLDRVCPRIGMEDVERFIMRVEQEEKIEYAQMQRRAIISALSNGVMILTGGPGTGKTTVICAILRIFENMGMKAALAAPTGRAAKRMSEATGSEAKTIHRMLEMEFSAAREPAFRRNENNFLDEDVLIIDESSMIDIRLMHSLLKAVKPGARLILIGDADQLPSVGAGNVLSDLIACDIFPTIMLKEIFRQARESLIVTNAHLINSGEYPELSTKNNDFFYIPRDESDIAVTIADLCKNRLPRKYGEDIAAGIQVITPSHKGAAGTDILNSVLQEVLNPPKYEKKYCKSRDIIYRVGDKVMQIRNNYDMLWKRGETEGIGVFNGDIGVIVNIDYGDEKVTIDFDGRLAEYDYTQLDEIEHAYAVTIHKSQGSEYPVVIIPAYDFAPRLLTRNLLYTAVTRAQQMVIIVGRQDVVNAMVDNNRLTNRYTGLREILLTLAEENEEK